VKCRGKVYQAELVFSVPASAFKLRINQGGTLYVTINMHLGLFQHTHLPFGVASSPALFQKIMGSVMNGLEGGILNDFIVTGSNDETRFWNLEGTLEQMNSMGIKLTREKFVFIKPSVEYFAFGFDHDGIHPSPRKVQAIQELPVPENLTD